MGYGQIVPQWQPHLADEFLSVSSEEATKFREILSKNEGLYVGFSAAANVCASIKLLESGKI
jgi:cysteine synthase A